MNSAPWLRSLVSFTTASIVAVAIVAGCGGTSVDSARPATPGGGCSAAGQTGIASDGCNTCTCASGSWACTEACAILDGGADADSGSAICKLGESRPAGDGCNDCYCDGHGGWECTAVGCPKSPPVCNDGDSKTNFCSGCTCVSGAWQCDPVPCQVSVEDGPSPKSCGGRLGQNCAATEYCAYTVNSGACGITDGTAVCETRPANCDAVYAPVCGCDNKTYSSSCEAARAGTGSDATARATRSTRVRLQRHAAAFSGARAPRTNTALTK